MVFPLICLFVIALLYAKHINPQPTFFNDTDTRHVMRVAVATLVALLAFVAAAGGA